MNKKQWLVVALFLGVLIYALVGAIGEVLQTAPPALIVIAVVVAFVLLMGAFALRDRTK